MRAPEFPDTLQAESTPTPRPAPPPTAIPPVRKAVRSRSPRSPPGPPVAAPSGQRATRAGFVPGRDRSV